MSDFHKSFSPPVLLIIAFTRTVSCAANSTTWLSTAATFNPYSQSVGSSSDISSVISTSPHSSSFMSTSKNMSTSFPNITASPRASHKGMDMGEPIFSELKQHMNSSNASKNKFMDAHFTLMNASQEITELARNSLVGIFLTFVALVIILFFVVLFLLFFGCIQGADQPVPPPYYSYTPDRYHDDDLSEEIYSMQSNRKKFG